MNSKTIDDLQVWIRIPSEICPLASKMQIICNGPSQLSVSLGNKKLEVQLSQSRSGFSTEIAFTAFQQIAHKLLKLTIRSSQEVLLIRPVILLQRSKEKWECSRKLIQWKRRYTSLELGIMEFFQWELKIGFNQYNFEILKARAQDAAAHGSIIEWMFLVVKLFKKLQRRSPLWRGRELQESVFIVEDESAASMLHNPGDFLIQMCPEIKVDPLKKKKKLVYPMKIVYRTKTDETQSIIMKFEEIEKCSFFFNENLQHWIKVAENGELLYQEFDSQRNYLVIIRWLLNSPPKYFNNPGGFI